MRHLMMTAAIAASTLSAAAFTGSAARAADPAAPGKPVGYITIEAKTVAVGAGYTWGDGVLRFHGKSYHFDVKGLDVADVGYSRVVGHGRVYGLKKVADFSGTYGAATGEATLSSGVAGQYLRNANGIELRIDDVTKGARLAGAAGGVQLTLR